MHLRGAAEQCGAVGDDDARDRHGSDQIRNQFLVLLVEVGRALIQEEDLRAR